jgi:sporulation protein YlmC with PRC-barrel domain
MRPEEAIFLCYRLLDEQILDSDGRRCGRVDDIELHGSPPRVTGLLVGDGLYPRRLPPMLARIARRLIGPERWGSNAVRVPWEAVDRIDAAVHLRGKAGEHGLGAGDDPEGWMVSRLPWN